MFATIKKNPKTKGHDVTLKRNGFKVLDWQVEKGGKKGDPERKSMVPAWAIEIGGFTPSGKDAVINCRTSSKLIGLAQWCVKNKHLMRYSTRIACPDGETRFGFHLAGWLSTNQQVRQMLGFDMSALIAVPGVVKED